MLKRLPPNGLTPEQARRKVRTALDNGIITKPTTCENCGKEIGLAKDGRSNLQAHHKDYNKPLDIEWLCVKCHVQETDQEVKGQRVSKALTGRTLDEEHKTAIQQGVLTSNKIRPDNLSGHKGVSWYAPRNRWRTTINYNGKQFHLGTYKTKEQAAKAYQQARNRVLTGQSPKQEK